MKKLSERNKKLIVNALNTCFFENKIELDKYMLNNAEKLLQVSKVNITTDDFIDDLCDNMSETYEDFARNTIKILTTMEIQSKIKVNYVAPYYYIESTDFGKNAYQGNREKYITKLEEISEKTSLNKGSFFEKFCTFFLQDIGFEVNRTNYSGDDGIDIFGKIRKSSTNKIIDFLFSEDIYLLAQVKFYDSKVDVPVIRKLIGDSLFYRFNKYDDFVFIGNSPLYLIVFSHRGFYKKAENFAKQFKVATIDSDEMIDILCNMPDINKLKSIKFLNEYTI